MRAEPLELAVLEPERFTRADWEELFREATRGLDPWALDLTALLGRFREFLAKTPVELRVPGRMVFASSVLLRMKSERMDGATTLAEAVAAVLAAEEAAARAEPEPLPALRLPLRRRPRARLTLADLRRAFLAVQGRPPKPKEKPKATLPVEEEPFSLRAARLLQRLLRLVNGSRFVPFSRLVPADDPGEKVARFLELLHLDGQGQVRLHQPEFLGEILVEVPHGP
ncbi:MAG: hypothetical protein NZ924_06540 [Candidatus Bipolaricaulota bacterium]|nr:hypothetical protein [Candidatus Bipolaricaulota bacterium]MDW8152537.1 hypothetical protein [Candidatus Bipolaricaulota bacterium]